MLGKQTSKEGTPDNLHKVVYSQVKIDSQNTAEGLCILSRIFLFVPCVEYTMQAHNNIHIFIFIPFTTEGFVSQLPSLSPGNGSSVASELSDREELTSDVDHVDKDMSLASSNVLSYH